MNTPVPLLVAPLAAVRAPLPPAGPCQRWEISLPVDLVIPGHAPTLIPTGWGLQLPDALTEGRLTLHPDVSDRLDLVNRPCGTIDADYVGRPVGLIVRTKRAHAATIKAGTLLGILELHRIALPAGGEGSPVQASTGTLVRATNQAACADISTSTLTDIVLDADGIYPIPVDLVLEVAHRHYASVRSRSGLALTHGLSLIAPCPIQTASYKDISAPLQELTFEKRGGAPLIVTPGMRIAQIGCAELGNTLLPMEFVEVASLEAACSTGAGSRTGGFGSTKLAAAR